MSTSYFFFFIKTLVWMRYRGKKYTRDLSTDVVVTENLKEYTNDVMTNPFRDEKDRANTEYIYLRNSTFRKRFVKAKRGSHKMNSRSQKILKRLISYAMNDDSFCSLSLLHWNLKKRLISEIISGYLRHVSSFLFHTREIHSLTTKKEVILTRIISPQFSETWDVFFLMIVSLKILLQERRTTVFFLSRDLSSSVHLYNSYLPRFLRNHVRLSRTDDVIEWYLCLNEKITDLSICPLIN